MIAAAKKTLKDGTAYGIVLTLLVAGLASLGALDAPEHGFYDSRAKYCQYFTPPPTDRLVHLDIDDAAMDSIGAWAWPRSTLAEMVDEIHLAGPKALAFDIIFQDPAATRFVRTPDGKFEEINDDQIFADSLKRSGCAIIPLSLPHERPKKITPLEKALRDCLGDDLELTENDVPTVLKKRGFDQTELDKAINHGFLEAFLQVRRDVMHDRVLSELAQRSLTPDQLRGILLPKTDNSVHSVASRLLQDEYVQAMSEISVQRFGGPVPPGLPPLLDSKAAMTPIERLSRAASATGFVDNPKDTSGVTRRLPMFMEYRGRTYPEIGLELAAMMLDADLSAAHFTNHEITIPCRNGKTIVIPAYTATNDAIKRPVPTMFDLPYFGPPDHWEAMYDKVGGAHLSLNVVWDVCLTQHRIRQNNLQADEALKSLYEQLAPEKLDPFLKHTPAADDWAARNDLIRAALADFGPFIEDAEKTNLADIKDPGERAQIEVRAAQGRPLRNVMAENPKLQAQLLAQRAELRTRLHDKAILIGWTSTAFTFDEAATSIHSKCPGVVVHGVIFNAIMTGFMWRRVPMWVDIGLIIAMGLLATVLATRLPPYRALVGATMLAFIYAVVNGFLIFDWGRHIATLAGPIVAIAAVWAGCTLARLLQESFERARITRRFQTYVDPALVQYVIEHPEIVRLEGEVREMTVCFTDLVGFTSLAERLREKAVKILSRYIAKMVPPIRRYRGFVHRFMGDGIMFSYGAPVPNLGMASDAVSTILEMHVELAKFNEELALEGYPPLSLRAGVNTGPAVVGDSGADDAVEYACLGHTTNLAARLESANTAVGTATLIAERTAEMLNGSFLVRPVARLVVKGTKEAVMTYEPIAFADKATPEQVQLVELTIAVFDHFIAGRFEACIEAANRFEETLGKSKLAGIYRELSKTYLVTPLADFRGHVVLTEK